MGKKSSLISLLKRWRLWKAKPNGTREPEPLSSSPATNVITPSQTQESKTMTCKPILPTQAHISEIQEEVNAILNQLHHFVAEEGANEAAIRCLGHQFADLRGITKRLNKVLSDCATNSLIFQNTAEQSSAILEFSAKPTPDANLHPATPTTAAFYIAPLNLPLRSSITAESAQLGREEGKTSTSPPQDHASRTMDQKQADFPQTCGHRRQFSTASKGERYREILRASSPAQNVDYDENETETTNSSGPMSMDQLICFLREGGSLRDL